MTLNFKTKCLENFLSSTGALVGSPTAPQPKGRIQRVKMTVHDGSSGHSTKNALLERSLARKPALIILSIDWLSYPKFHMRNFSMNLCQGHGKVCSRRPNEAAQIVKKYFLNRFLAVILFY